MSRVLKYNLTDGPVLMPLGAVVIHVAMQRGYMRLWAIVDDAQTTMEKRQFDVVGTGIHFNAAGKQHIATVIDGQFVWHAFEVTR